jgi:lysophospholipase L1-like esterase
MRTVLAYGDSLTWGTDAQTMGRHAHSDLWPTVLAERLGSDTQVINASLGGRTTMFDDHGVVADRNGARILPTVLGMFEPIDLVIVMLGSNDIKTFTGGTAVAAGQGVHRLLEIVQRYPYSIGSAPDALVISPPEVLQLVPSERFPLMSTRTDAWAELAPTYRRVADSMGAGFFDAATVANAKNGGDGVHLDAANTRAIGEALAPIVSGILGRREARLA